jgi:ribosomal protein S18 acetylase RimI-like enzyme
MSAPDRELLPSVDLIRHTVAIEAAYTISRLRVLERLDDNPIGIGYRRAGQRAWCLMARHLPVPSFNNVVGLEDGDEGELPAIIDWYRAKDVRFQVEIVPGFETAALTRRLAELGFHQSGFHVSMIARPVDVVAPAGIFDIWRVRDAAMFEEFLDAYIAGWKIPDGEGFKRNVRPWLEMHGWSLFLGRINGKPAAEAISYLDGDFCYLADASTDPVFRNRGLHTALVAHRLRDAAGQGARFACSGAAFGSASHRNMEKAGMKLQFVRALWTRL